MGYFLSGNSRHLVLKMLFVDYFLPVIFSFLFLEFFSVLGVDPGGCVHARQMLVPALFLDFLSPPGPLFYILFYFVF